VKLATLFLTLSLFSCTHQQTYVYAAPVVRQADPVYNGVAQVFVQHEGGEAVGTAFAVRNINNNTYLVTVDHLCERRGRKAVVAGQLLTDGERKKYSAQIVYSSSEDDMCIIRAYGTADDFTPLQFSRRPVQPGDRVYTIGSPSGAFPTKTEGYVVGHDLLGMEPEQQGEPKSLLVTSIPAFRGNSGGPVYDERHEVVGMLAATHVEYPHSSISIHVDSILEHLKKYFKKDFQ
jgi:S1-C subfamily serine protease